MATADQLIKEINKSFGDGSAFAAKDMPPVQYVPSGSLALDFAVGKGIPRNRVVEILGSEGSGKTTLALLIARQVLDEQPDRLVLFLDMEHKLTPEWMEQLVGPERMPNIVIVNPDTIEQATEMYRQAVRKGVVAMAILDSIGGAPTAQTMDEARSAEQADSMGGNAKGVTKFARFAANLSAKYDCLTVGINQLRDDTKSRHGNMIMTPGGRGWKHACVLRIYLRRGKEKYFEKHNGEDILVGFDVIAQCIKNHVGIENRTAQWRFFTQDCQYAPMGVDTTEECVRLSELTGVVTRGGSYYYHAALPADKQGKNRVNGKAALLEAIQTDEALRGTIISEVMAALADPDADLSEIAPMGENLVDGDDAEGGVGLEAAGREA